MGGFVWMWPSFPVSAGRQPGICVSPPDAPETTVAVTREPAALTAHLSTWLGQWPPRSALDVTTAAGRTQPGWDGSVRAVLGVGTPAGVVLSVPPSVIGEIAGARDLDEAGRRLAAAPGRPGARLTTAAFRWSVTPADLTDEGEWLPADDPRVPEWLRPFGGSVLVTLVDDGYAAGVGIKRHDPYGHELSVGTDEAFRGRGLAARLVATAARRIVADGRVATYLHAYDNVASARTADRAGFPDRGWFVIGLTEPRD